MVKFEMIGGRTCLDFVNTGSQRRVGPFLDKLASYDDLLSWAVQAEQLTEVEAEQLRVLALRLGSGVRFRGHPSSQTRRRSRAEHGCQVRNGK